MNTLRSNAWPYRDYVIRAFNRDTPYPQFVREQLAGDVVAGADPVSLAATGFLTAGPHDLVGNATLEGQLQQRMDDLFDMVSSTANTFLGLTIGCARCHDHKFDPITQKDFYALQAVFAVSNMPSVKSGWRPETNNAGRSPCCVPNEIGSSNKSMLWNTWPTDPARSPFGRRCSRDAT